MTSDEKTSQSSSPTPSRDSFDDLPLIELWQANPAEMTQEQRVAFLTELNRLRQYGSQREKLQNEVKPQKEKTNKGPSASELWDSLLTEDAS